LKALEMCMVNFKDYVNQAGDNSCQGMLEASNLSGKGINIAKTTAAHAWSYGLSTKHDVAHGHAVWATLPLIYKIHSSPSSDLIINDKRGYKHLNLVMKKISKILGIKNQDIELFFEEMLLSIDIRAHLINDFHLSITDRVILMESLNSERMANNPVSFSKDQINKIFFIN
jgi:alcohol dehydrogenase